MTDTSKIPSSRISNSTFENNQILLINDGNIIINDTSITNYILEINQPTTISISSNITLPANISLPIQLEIKKTDINATITFPQNDNFKWIDNYIPSCSSIATYYIAFKTKDMINWVCSYQGMIE
jgi:hypothetical protein